MPPKLWPKRFQYARSPVSTEIHPSILEHCLQTGKPEDLAKESQVIENRCVSPNMEIKKITYTLKDHPLFHKKTLAGHANYGVFAKEAIPDKTELGEYVGEMMIRNMKDVKINDDLEYTWMIVINDIILVIDAKRVANELALVNDYHGLSDAPNVKMAPIIHQGRYHFCYITTRDIQKGEEILVDYNEIAL